MRSLWGVSQVLLHWSFSSLYLSGYNTRGAYWENYLWPSGRVWGFSLARLVAYTMTIQHGHLG